MGTTRASRSAASEPGYPAAVSVLTIMAVLLLVFALSLGQAIASPPSSGRRNPTVAAQADERAAQQQPSAPRHPAPAGQSPTSTSGLLDVVSIDRIRKELERTPSLSFTMPDSNVARYRIEVQENRFKAPDFLKNFVIPTSPVSQPLGGSDYYEMMRLNTPPQYWGSAPFTNGDLLKMSALTGAYGLAGALVRKGMEARQSAAAARAHQEVQEELAALAEANARAAAGQANPPDGKATADKKKPSKKKKGP